MSDDENDYNWRNPRPILAIEPGDGKKLGNCYYGSKYRITSAHALDCKQIRALRDAGFLGYGQEFYILGQEVGDRMVAVPAEMTNRDWKMRQDVECSGIDEVPPTVYNSRTGKIVDAPAIHRYTKEVVTSTVKFPFYVYITEDRVDSSD